MSGARKVSEEKALLRRWFMDHALPLWWLVGGDREEGGFFEKIDNSLAPIAAPRRARLVARQIFVYATAHELGCNQPCGEIVEHGLSFLTQKLLREDGTVISSVHPSGDVIQGAFDLYDYAFVLFGLAAAARELGDREALSQRANKIRDRMIAGWAHPVAGFQESQPPSAPLRANPHMHLLEAFLAWSELALPGCEVWDRLADEIAELCLSRFIDPATGAVRETYDLDWHALSLDQGQLIEPGHQFEWAWLLLRWAQLRGRPDAAAAAMRLVEIGERHGIDSTRGLVVNGLSTDLTLLDAKARLWPQTERIKAWHAVAQTAGDPQMREQALERLALAIAGLRQYFAQKPDGLWWETINPDASFDPEPSRASSLYHIACAIHTIEAPVVR